MQRVHMRHAVGLVALLGWTGCTAPTDPAVDAGGDPPVLVFQAEARSHLTSAPGAAYPVFARAAGVTGAVLYEIDISQEGRVAAARLIHGSPILEQTARDAILQWRFSPFQADGRLVTARTIVTMTFSVQPVPADVASALDRFADAMLLCVDATRRSAFTDAETRCAAAAEIAAELASFDRTSDARPMRLHGEAVAGLGRHEEALTRFETAAARLRHVPVFSLDRALALRALGHSLAALGRNDEALIAWRQADQQLTEALASAQRHSSFRAETIEHLRSFLPQYVELLVQSGRAAEAGPIRSRLEAMQ